MKFRVWDEVNKKMSYETNQEVFLSCDGTPTFVVEFSGGKEDAEFILLRSTGLKDKNGKEIYEGDVIAKFKDWWGHEQINGVVEYQSGAAKFIIRGSAQNGAFDFVRPSLGYEVIGNIFEDGYE